MANKKYKMTVSLSDGSTVDAGTFIAPQGPKGDTGTQGPQGPQGPAGPAGVIGDWVSIAESNFTAEQNSVYIIRADGYDGDTALLSTRTGLTTKMSFISVGSDSATITHYMVGSNGKFSRIRVAKITSGNVTVQTLNPSSGKDILYIKIK